MLIKSYPYKMSASMLLLCGLFFAACTLVLGYMAITNDRGLILNGVITFSEAGASTFYWVLAALCLLMLVGGLFGGIRSMGGPSNLEIAKSEVRIPTGVIKRRLVKVLFAEVESIYEKAMQSERFFYLQTANRKSFISRTLMPSHEAYEEAKTIITDLLEQERGLSRDPTAPDSTPPPRPEPE